MSNHTNNNLYVNPRYINQHVGGRGKPPANRQYIGEQMEFINAQKSQLPPTLRNHQQLASMAGLVSNEQQMTETFNKQIKYHQESGTPLGKNFNTRETQFPNKRSNFYSKNGERRYDPYEGFLFKLGLLDDGLNRRRFVTTYLDIDSSVRKKLPSLDLDDTFFLNANPIDVTPGSSGVFIVHVDHPYEEGDLISLSGVVGDQSELGTFGTDGNPSFVILRGCNVMKVFVSHDLPSNYIGEDITVEFNGIRGDRGTIQTSSFLGNIPINIINTTHPMRVVITAQDNDVSCDEGNLPPNFFDFSEDYFFVVLPIALHDPTEDAAFVLRDYNYFLSKKSIGGIPLNRLNAKFPINPDNLQGFHIIKSTTRTGYTIEVPTVGVLDLMGGGNNITVAKVLNVDTGYPNPNSYIIDLGRTFHDILTVRMVSSEFPNSERIFKDFPENRVNNKIYWNDIDDGDFLYSIEIPSGNYTPAQLATVLESLFFQTQRINSGSDPNASYDPNHFIIVDINTSTDEVSFRSFKQFTLIQPFIATTPEITANASLDSNDPDAQYTVTVNHTNHGITSAGGIILISGAIEFSGIPASSINGEHIVTNVIDVNNYQFILPRLNLSEGRSDSKGGVNVTIFTPDLFRMRFDQPDTAGQLLGFRNPGEQNSISSFATTVSNKNPYEFDTYSNALGEIIQIENNSIQLSGDDYVLMVARPLVTLFSIGPTKKAFAKLQLCDGPAKVLFNSFVPTSRFYDDPIHELSELEIEYYTPDGTLYDFNGLDHSFTLEIVTVHDIPAGSGINANTGKNYNNPSG
jgi:hypothetical protein